MKQAIRKGFIYGGVLAMLLIILWLLYSRQQYREAFNESYQDKVKELNSKVETKFIENKKLLDEVSDLKAANEVHRTKRAEVKVKWMDKFIEVQSACDSLNLNELHSLHMESEMACDTLVFGLELQVDKLEKVISNDSVIVQAKDSIIDLYSTAYVELEEKADKDKNKSFRNGFKWGFGTGFVSGFISRFFLQKKE